MHNRGVQIGTALISSLVSMSSFSGTFLDSLDASPNKVASSPYATGGDIVLKLGDDYVHVFTNSAASASFVPARDLSACVLIVGGGGAGGSCGTSASGGGGGGGVVYLSGQTLTWNASLPVVVGRGGYMNAAAVSATLSYKGGDSSFAGTTAYGGGNGVGWEYNNNTAYLPLYNGASSGGGARNVKTSMTFVEGQGHKGGSNPDTAGSYRAGGGGGAGSPGESGTLVKSGNGGDGLVYFITGAPVSFGAGGAAGVGGSLNLDQAKQEMRTFGGENGGCGAYWDWGQSKAVYATAGEDGTGSGGGGANGKLDNKKAQPSGVGGSGIVVVRYTDPTVTESTPVAIASVNQTCTSLSFSIDAPWAVGGTVQVSWGYDDAFSLGTTEAVSIESALTPVELTGLNPGRQYRIRVRVEADEVQRILDTELSTKAIVSATPTFLPEAGKNLSYFVAATPSDGVTTVSVIEDVGSDVQVLGSWTLAAASGMCSELLTFPSEYAGTVHQIALRTVSEVDGFSFTNVTDAVTLMFSDNGHYYWKGDRLTGNWNNPDCWDSSAGYAGYPASSSAIADFSRCPSDGSEMVVTVPESLTISKVTSATSGQRLTFSGPTSVTVNANIDLSQAAATNTIRGISWTTSSALATLSTGEAFFVEGGSVVKTKPPAAKNSNTLLYVGSGASLDLSGDTLGNNQSAFTAVIDDGLLKVLKFSGGNNGAGFHDFILKGTNPRLIFTGVPDINVSWKRVRFRFEVPEGGFASAPVTTTTTSGAFFNVGTSWNNFNLQSPIYKHANDDEGIRFEIATESPHLTRRGGKLNQELFRWNDKGISRGSFTKNGVTTEYDMLNCIVLENAITGKGNVLTALSLRTDADGEGKYAEYATPAAAIENNAVITTVAVDIQSSNGLMFYIR